MEYEIPCEIQNSMWNTKFHVEYEIPWGIQNSMWNTKFHVEHKKNTKFHVEYKIPCGLQNSMWFTKFHVEYKIPVENRILLANGILPEYGIPEFGISMEYRISVIKNSS